MESACCPIPLWRSINPMPAPALQLSHFGLFVRDIDKIVDFYETVMGFTVTDRGVLNGNRIVFLSRDPREHHQIVFVAGRDSDRSVKLLNQMSFRLETLSELLVFAKNLAGWDVSDLEPIIHGPSWSLYFRDPEGNRVEVFVDSEWYIPQPVKEVLDFSLSEEEILRRTKEYCEAQPGFRPMHEWREEISARMMRNNAAP